MTLLDNELVKKYFGCELHYNCSYVSCNPGRALAVLSAMQEPIRKGERYLCSDNSDKGAIKEEIAFADYPPWWNITGIRLRLPSSFQPKAEKCCCGESDSIHRTDGPCYKIQKPDPVEEKIKEVVSSRFTYGVDKSFSELLRELVTLARGSK